MISVSVIVVTKNEEHNIARCLDAIKGFSEVIVADSNSTDKTVEIAEKHGAKVINFDWNRQYPKKRQYCLDHLEMKNDWVFWVDADEVLTPKIIEEIRTLFMQERPEAGFFVRGQYVWQGKKLQFGLRNNKIAMMHKDRMMFPVVDDLAVEGMGEIEGHYQPVLREERVIGQIQAPLIHYAQSDRESWERRHDRYARWETEMTKRNSWPKDPVWWREQAKKSLRTSFLRPYMMFSHSFILKKGFLDGKEGYDFAKSRMNYAKKILRNKKAL
ncbi:MAG: glycosyltransferase [Alphaproteobacteria bacterium]|nr:glycosyltransferase [Alphaproteobacteria bacterium]